jgi:hypothetical protein
MSEQARRYGCIEALLRPKTLEITEERIKFGFDVDKCNVTELRGYEIKSKKHRKWLRSLLKKHLMP